MRAMHHERCGRRGEIPGFGERGTGFLRAAGWLAVPALVGPIGGLAADLGLPAAPALGWLVALLVPAFLLLVPTALSRWAGAWRVAPPLLAWSIGVLGVVVRPEPLPALVMLGLPLLVTAGWLGWLSPPLEVPPGEGSRRSVGALAGVVVLWLLSLEAQPGAAEGHVALAGGLVTAVAGLRTLDSTRRMLVVAIALLPILPFTSPGAMAVPGLLVLVALTLREQSETGALGVLLADPARVMVGTFVLVGLAGAALLALPEASESRAPLAFVDALFTAFSAVCVTGLSVVDTPTTFSLFGEATIALLIQVGGLGIMTFSTAAVVLAGERLSLRHESTAASLLKAQDHSKIGDLLRLTFKVTLAIELAGVVALAACFWLHGDGFASGLWRALFTSVSAFNNAGFALQSDNLITYQSNPGVLITVALLIITGGLGPVVVAGLVQRRLEGLHIRLVVATTAALLVGGWILFAAAEWSNTLKDMGFFDKLVNAFFLSVTPRTAGFNSIDYAAVTPATFTLTLVLMFIGGSPGSTAGGIKTTTLAVLVLLVRQAFRGESRVNAFGYSLKVEALRESVAVTVLSAVTVLGLLLSLNLTQSLRFEVALFESISAVGTVGLSVGGTAQLDVVGKVLVTVGMLAGRVGPLTLLLVVGRHRSRGTDWRPEGRVDVG